MTKSKLPRKVRGQRKAIEVLIPTLIEVLKTVEGKCAMLMLFDDKKEKRRRVSVTKRGKFFAVYGYKGGGWYELLFERRNEE